MTGARLWDAHAERDPLWAILSDPNKRDGKWDVKKFFLTGVGEISSLIYRLRSNGIAAPRGRALDFGCGVGRLSQALAAHVDHVTAVDISPRMIQLANALNRLPGRVSYVCNQRDDLAPFGDASFDFILSNIVLQHVPPQASVRYLSEFMRLLAPAGVLVFQLPSHQRGPDEPPPLPVARDMPDDAYDASIVVMNPPDALEPGAHHDLNVEVTNRSRFSWLQSDYGVINAGNHWLDVGGRMFRRDDGRSRLPGVLHPDESCCVALPIEVPADPGNYFCEIDLAHEGVQWFGDKGSPVLRLLIRVGMVAEPAAKIPARHAARDLAASAELPGELPPFAGGNLQLPDPGEFPMHSVKQEAVVDLVTQHRGELLLVEPDSSCGGEWISYRYFVMKRR